MQLVADLVVAALFLGLNSFLLDAPTVEAADTSTAFFY